MAEFSDSENDWTDDDEADWTDEEEAEEGEERKSKKPQSASSVLDAHIKVVSCSCQQQCAVYICTWMFLSITVG